MIVRHLLLILIVFYSTYLDGQEIYPQLTRKLEGYKDSTVLIKIDKIYAHELAKKPQDELMLKFWKFTMFDSLKYDDLKDTLCLELLPNANKIKYPKSSRLYLIAGLKEVDEIQFQTAISLFHKGLLIAKKYKDYKNACILLKNIGTTYLKVKDFKTAEKHLREDLYIAKKHTIEQQISSAYISLGNAMKGQGDLNSAVVYYEKSLEIALRLNEVKIISNCYNNLGNVCRRQKKYQKALDYFEKALVVNRKADSKINEAMNYSNMGITYVDMGQYETGIKYSKLAIDITKQIGNELNLITYYDALSNAYLMNNDYENAYLSLNENVKLSNNLNIKEQTNLLKDLEAKYQSEKKQTEIKQLKMGNELQNVKNDSLKMQAQKNKKILALSVIAVISLVIGMIVLYKTNKRRRQTNRLLYIKNNEIEKSNNSLQLALNELSVKNKEVIDSINYATYIQQAALPNISQISIDQLHFELFFAPKDIVSGDFYFSYQLYDTSIFGVADCTGHGVPGAMVSLVGMNSLDKVVREENHKNSSSMIESFNEHVKASLNRGGESTNDGMDISFCYLNHEDNVLHFTGANHTAIIIRDTEKNYLECENDRITLKLTNDRYSLIQLSGVRRPIGKSISQEPFYEVNFEMMKTDKIVLFSDGFADQIGGKNEKKLKKGTLLSMLLESSGLPIKDQLAFMKNGFELWKGDLEQVDDVCLLIVEVLC